MIGSANFMRRSLYSDWEHSVSFIDEEGELVKNFRKELWSNIFKHFIPDDFDTIEHGLFSWDNSWGMPGSSPQIPGRFPELSGPPYIERIQLPVPIAPFDEKELEKYNNYTDLDSRQDWGGLCP